MAWEPVIGLECHVQLRTRTKMFCGCPVAFGSEPNTNVCPVCLGLPGALPRANAAAVGHALRLGARARLRASRATACSRARTTSIRTCRRTTRCRSTTGRCARAVRCAVTLDGTARDIRLTRIHLEEDAGKSFHPERHGDRRLSRVDFNRAGVPLLELVTEPVLRSPEECARFLTVVAAARTLARDLRRRHGEGPAPLRRERERAPRGCRHARHQDRAQEPEQHQGGGARRARRDRAAGRSLDGGERVEQATLLYDADHDRLAVMRTKEARTRLPLLPRSRPARAARSARRRVNTRTRGAPRAAVGTRGALPRGARLPAYDASVLAESRELSEYFEVVRHRAGEAREQLGDDRTAARAARSAAGRVEEWAGARARRALRGLPRARRGTRAAGTGGEAGVRVARRRSRGA